MIYTQTTKEKVIKPSQWKDDMYISLTWNDNNDLIEIEDDESYICPDCKLSFACCECD
jgi:hypothetical protein